MFLVLLKMKVKLSLLFTATLVSSACASDPAFLKDTSFMEKDCSFINQHDHYQVEDAKLDSMQAFSEGDYHLWRVADGIGPSTLGLDSVTSELTDAELTCLATELNRYEEKMLNVGTDVGFCKQQIELSKKANQYAHVFNATMLERMVSKGLHQCDLDKKRQKFDVR